MNWEKIIVSFSKMLTSHARSIILLFSLVLIGVLSYGFSVVVQSASDATAMTSIWLYFISVVISFGVIITVLFLAARGKY